MGGDVSGRPDAQVDSVVAYYNLIEIATGIQHEHAPLLAELRGVRYPEGITANPATGDIFVLAALIDDRGAGRGSRPRRG